LEPTKQVTKGTQFHSCFAHRPNVAQCQFYDLKYRANQ